MAKSSSEKHGIPWEKPPADVTATSPAKESPPLSVTSGGEPKSPGQGRWTEAEHKKFVELYEKLGNQWTRIAEAIPPRSAIQVRSHAQGYQAKLARRKDAESSPAASRNSPKKKARAKESPTKAVAAKSPKKADSPPKKDSTPVPVSSDKVSSDKKRKAESAGAETKGASENGKKQKSQTTESAGAKEQITNVATVRVPVDRKQLEQDVISSAAIIESNRVRIAELEGFVQGQHAHIGKLTSQVQERNTVIGNNYARMAELESLVRAQHATIGTLQATIDTLMKKRFTDGPPANFRDVPPPVEASKSGSARQENESSGNEDDVHTLKQRIDGMEYKEQEGKHQRCSVM